MVVFFFKCSYSFPTGGGGSGASATAVINSSGNITGTTSSVAGSDFTSVPNVAITYGGYSQNYSANSSITPVVSTDIIL